MKYKYREFKKRNRRIGLADLGVQKVDIKGVEDSRTWGILFRCLGGDGKHRVTRITLTDDALLGLCTLYGMMLKDDNTADSREVVE